MKKGVYLSVVLRSKKTVFSLEDFALLWKSPTTNATQVRLNAYVKKGEFVHLRRGLYAKDRNYNRLELATRIYTPAYVSFETVLAKAGINFQFYSQIFVASYLSREIVVDQQTYSFKKIKDSILMNPKGIENQEAFSIASAERAFLDTLYADGNRHFDNLRPLRWERVFELLPIYENKRMEKFTQKLYKSVPTDRESL